MIKLSSRRSGKIRVLHCSFQDVHCIQFASELIIHLTRHNTCPWKTCLSACVVYALHDACHDCLVICWGKSSAISQNAHGREKSFYQHTCFMIYWTHIMKLCLLSGACRPKNAPCLWTRCVQFGCLMRRTFRESSSWTILPMLMNQFGLRRQLISLRRGCGGASEKLLRQRVIFRYFFVWNMLRSNIPQEEIYYSIPIPGEYYSAQLWGNIEDQHTSLLGI